MLKKIFSFFKNPNDKYLTPKMKKKKRKLTWQSYSLYGLFSLLFLTWIFIALAGKFRLFEVEQEDIKISGWVLLIFIVIIYFTGKRIVASIKKIADKSTSIWLDQVFVLIPLLLAVLAVAFINYKVEEVLYVLIHTFIARLVFTPIHAGYLSAHRKLEIFKSNVDEHVKKKSQADFEKEFDE